MNFNELAWDIFVTSGTVYLIVAHGWNPWWMLPALMLLEF